MKKKGFSRREFLQIGAGAAAGIMTGSLTGCSGGSGSSGFFLNNSVVFGRNQACPYHGSRDIIAVFQPASSAITLYRSLLPTAFDMPDTLQVIVSIVSYYSVTLPLVPYLEGFVMLACKYRGADGLYTLSMPVTDKTANDLGISMGFPGFLADSITLTSSNNTWSGEVIYQRQSMIKMTFTPQSGTTTANRTNPGPPLFNLLPPGVGTQVVIVNCVGNQQVSTTTGTVTVTVDQNAPWSQLLAGASLVSAYLEEITGDWTLANNPVVSIVRIQSGDINSAVQEAINLLGGISAITLTKQKIMLKPNLVGDSATSTTKPAVVSALAQLMLNAGKEVSIGEGSAACVNYNILNNVVYRTKKAAITPATALALSPKQLVLVVNRSVPESRELAEYYMKRRSIPPENLVEISTVKEEQISREDYDRTIAAPIRDWLRKNDPDGKKFECLLLMYGIPLRVAQPVLSAEEKKQLAMLEERRVTLAREMAAPEKINEKASKTLKDEEESLLAKIRQVSKTLSGASVDSELALVMEREYPLEGWLPNRYFVGFQKKEIKNIPQKVIMVSRLDGPSTAVVRRMIDDSIEAEKRGLTGKAYFDARWPLKEKKDLSAYEKYDRAIHNAARIVGKSKKLPVVLDERERLFQPGEAPDAALYCGWYSLGKYVDAFTWARGAVGYHVASSECVTLKKEKSTVWCKMMLEKGVAATLGPVAEPYLQSFPQPEVFFGCLLDGRFTLAECYTLANPFWSWQMVLLGDPLYRPFSYDPKR